MSLNGINVSTFSVPSGQILLYQLENTIYQKNSSGLVEPSSAGIVNCLGLDITDLPSLVYETDLQQATNISPVNKSQMSVGSAVKPGNVYANLISGRKLDKHEFLNVMFDVNNTIKSTVRAVEVLPDANTVPVGTVLMYIGATSSSYSVGSLYITDGTIWSELIAGGASTDTTALESLIAANTSRIVVLEDKLQKIMEHLGIDDPTPATYANEAEAAAAQAGTDAGVTTDLATEATNTGTEAASI